jgi:hypothetical protein
MANVVEDALHFIYAELRIDEEWTAWRDSGFSWLGYRLRQDFEVGPAFIDAGTDLHRVYSTVPILENVRAPEDRVWSALALLNRFAVGEAMVWEPEARRVVCHLGAPVHSETLSWRPAQIADFAILALRTCEDRAEPLAELLDGTVAEWRHPSSGKREAPDEMLFVGQNAFAPEGDKESRFTNDAEMQAIYREVENSPFFSAGASADGLCIEVPFGDDTILAEIRTGERHPALGSGLLNVLKMRLPPHETRSPAEVAAMLNRREAQGELPSVNFGAWCVQELAGQEILAHARFTPNLLYRPLLAADITYSMINRALWVGAVLLPGEPTMDRTAAEIITNRLA